MLELPIVPGPGGVGRIRATGPDSTKLKVGDWVYCDATIRARDDAVNPETILLGWTARHASALPLHRYYHHGSFAEQLMLPTENVTPIGEVASSDIGRWSVLGRLLVPYGGLVAAGLRTGETLVVNGATGGFGSAAVVVALAMGAGRVVATGRNAARLDQLARWGGPRVQSAVMTGVEHDDRQLITALAGGPIDCVIDLLPRIASSAQVLAAMLAVRPGGRVVLMGGVGRAGGRDLALPYSWLVRNDITLRGKWMYPRAAVPHMVQLIRSGLIDLTQFELNEFPLDDVNDAITHAATDANALAITVVRPDMRR